MIDPGETPREAAVRELREESGQLPAGELRFTGYARFALAPDRRAEYGAVFTGRARDPSLPFQPNDEISAVRWWDLRGDLAGPAQEPTGTVRTVAEPVQALDVYLAGLTRTAVDGV
ncbi:NUDIX hydrolase [Streptomyces sp. NPDC056734]|uniref:NUDIX hydrolase n=1 Tax=Streptomyces sp. NPDC056734 TaxID=3345931 RepID=UPI00369129F8